MTSRIVNQKGRGGLVCSESGKPLTPPSGWALLPPGDAALTRRVKGEGEHWVVEDRSGRRVQSRGVWAPADRIVRHQQALERERATPAYAHRLQASRKRRAEQHLDYVEDFRGAVLEFLAFAPAYAQLASDLADAVTEHTTPVGSGTVGRTKRIPIEERASAAVIAWLRHQTTGYDDMEIARVKGRRRQVRRRLAQRSRELLKSFRRGDAVDVESCPLHTALRELTPAPPVQAGPAPAPVPQPAEPSLVPAEPSLAAAEPTRATAEPALAAAEPTRATAEPALAAAEPTRATAEPALAAAEPARAAAEPATTDADAPGPAPRPAPKRLLSPSKGTKKLRSWERPLSRRQP